MMEETRTYTGMVRRCVDCPFLVMVEETLQVGASNVSGHTEWEIGFYCGHKDRRSLIVAGKEIGVDANAVTPSHLDEYLVKTRESHFPESCPLEVVPRADDISGVRDIEI